MGDATDLLRNYASALSARLAGVTTEGPEAQLADLVPELLRGLARAQSRTGIDLRGQAHERAVGIPDFSVKDGLLLIGHVETKAPGVGADPGKFKSQHDKDQWQRFRNLPNLLYTDGEQWALYRSGKRIGRILQVDIPAPGEPLSADLPQQAASLLALAAQLFSWKAVSPSSLKGLAEALAPLTAVLRDEIAAQLVDENSQVHAASEEFRAALFPERSQDQIADAFAQVCAYSMLLARSRGAKGLSARDIEESLEHGHPVLARVVRVLLDQETENEIGWALDTVRSLIEVVDFEALRGGKVLPGMTHHDQTWLYFYEEFLAKYDPKLRDEYGVYYTPQNIISAQVRLLDELLHSRLGKAQGLASPGVTVLDPAVGTGSYPLKVVEAAAESALNAYGPESVAGAIGDLARNLFAFEILVGPYAVAHLRLTEILADFGSGNVPESVQVFLTDTLSSPYTEPTSLTRLLQPLVDEQRRALEVKDSQRILVCIGNPPYQRGSSSSDEHGEHGGGWVVHGDPQVDAKPIFDTFLRPATERTIFSHVASLYNEYVYFWRWALWKVFESPSVDGSASNHPGIVSFISAASYLRGPGFVGMREHLRRLCDEIWVIDLGGEGRGARREENVFAIQTPVAICVALRKGQSNLDEPASVKYTRIRGDRDEKLEVLGDVRSLQDLEWFDASTEWDSSFAPSTSESWEDWPLVIDLFPWQSPGVKAGRTWPIAPLNETLETRWVRLAAAKGTEDRDLCFVNPKHGRNTSSRVGLDTWPRPASAKKIEDLTPKDPAPQIVRYGFRPFDTQQIIADPRVIALQRPGMWWAHTPSQIYMIGFFTGILGKGSAVTASNAIPDLHAFRGSFGGKDVIPLYRSPDLDPNITGGLIEKLEERLGIELSPERLFMYCYCLLSSPSYVTRFWDELETPGPRVPITTDSALFEEVSALGLKVLKVHTQSSDSTGEMAAKAKLVKGIGLELLPDTVDYDRKTETLNIGDGVIASVSPEVWELSVSGWSVLERWIKWRLREPVGNARSSTSPLDRIRPTAWPHQYTAELLELIWTLERTVSLYDEQADLLARVCASETINASDLPMPSKAEREHPKPPKRRNNETIHPEQGDLISSNE